MVFSFYARGERARKFKCGADKRRRRGLDRAAPSFSPIPGRKCKRVRSGHFTTHRVVFSFYARGERTRKIKCNTPVACCLPPVSTAATQSFASIPGRECKRVRSGPRISNFSLACCWITHSRGGHWPSVNKLQGNLLIFRRKIMKYRLAAMRFCGTKPPDERCSPLHSCLVTVR